MRICIIYASALLVGELTIPLVQLIFVKISQQNFACWYTCKRNRGAGGCLPYRLVIVCLLYKTGIYVHIISFLCHIQQLLPIQRVTLTVDVLSACCYRLRGSAMLVVITGHQCKIIYASTTCCNRSVIV